MKEEIIIEFEKIFELSDVKAKIILDYLIDKPHQRLILTDMNESIFESLLKQVTFQLKNQDEIEKLIKY